MAVFEQWFKQDLLDPIKIHSCGDVVFNGDNFSNIVGVRVFRGGVPVSLTGTVICNVIRADGATVVIGNGSISGEFSNEVSVSLVSQALAIPGKLGVMLQLVNGDNKTTLLKVVYFSHQSSTSEIIDPGHIVPDIDDIIAKFDEMEAAIDACEAAADAASTAASEVNDIILVQDTQPVEETNKIWLPETIGEGVQVPTLDEFNDLKSAKVNIPRDENNQPDYGDNGQVLRSNGDGTTEWVNVGQPTDEQTEEAINEWLNDHPEATTTVMDESLTKVKFSNYLKLEAIKDYIIPEMFGAVGDASTDDTIAIISAIEEAQEKKLPLMILKEYKITEPIIISGTIKIQRSFNGRVIYDGIQDASLYAITFQPSDGDISTCIDIDLQVKNVSIQPYGAGGICVKNSMHSTIRIRSFNFSVGFRLTGEGHDCDYNYVYPDFIQDNKTGIMIDTDITGYVNQNTFIGGSIRVSSTTYTKLYEGDTFCDLYLSNGRTSYSSSPANNNTFIGVSFENVAGSDARQTNNINVEGAYNVLLNCRFEGITQVHVVGIGSMIIGGSQMDSAIESQLENAYILGSDNAYIPLRAKPLQLRSSRSADDKILSIMTPTRNETAYIYANGDASYKNVSVSRISFPSSASSQPRPEILFGKNYPDAESFAYSDKGVGTIYIVHDAYNYTYQRIYFKKASSSNSWAMIQCVHAASTRPAEHLNDGYMMFDTTLGKPIWYYNGNWVDATGQTVT